MSKMRVVAVVLLVLFARVGLAEPDSLTKAKETFRRGMELYDKGDYERAAISFQEAFSLSGRPGFLFNIAQAYRLAGRYGDSIAYYRLFVSRMPDAPQRAEADGYIAQLMTRLAEAAEAKSREAKAREAKEREAREREAKERDDRAREARTKQAPSVMAKPALTATSDSPSTAASDTVVAAKPKKRWVWGVVGGAVVLIGVGLGVGLGLGLQPKNPSADKTLTLDRAD